MRVHPSGKIAIRGGQGRTSVLDDLAQASTTSCLGNLKAIESKHLKWRFRQEMKTIPPSLVWPRLLELPPDNVLIVYLDLNHWIGLAQASVGHAKGSSVAEALVACRNARSAGTALFVLSGTIYAEMQKIKDPAQRRDLAEVMEELTDFATLIGRVVVMDCEISAMLDPFAKYANPLPNVPLVGRGVRHAFGLNSGIAIMDASGDATTQVRESIGSQKFDHFMAEMVLKMERSILRGPSNGTEVKDLRALGWNPEGPAKVAENRAVQERDFTIILDSEQRWRRGRLRDVVSLRELEIEFQNILPRALEERGLVFRDVVSDQDSARHFVRAMPSTEVSIELKTAWHRNGEKKWTVNDIYDIDAMALATPYCDVVVTEKACHHILEVAGLPERMGTALVHSLVDLPQILRERKSKRLGGRQTQFLGVKEPKSPRRSHGSRPV
jgi:hypothetical protein